MRLIYALIIVFLFGGRLYAQDMSTDRPDQTEGSSTLHRAHFQLESGLVLAYDQVNQDPRRDLLAPISLFRYGLTNGIELRMVSQFESVKYAGIRKQGIGDLELGVKLQITEKGNSPIEMAFISHLVLPTGTKEVSAGQTGVVNKFAFSNRIGDQLGLGYNLGYNYFGSGKGDLTYSIALGIAVNHQLGVYLEAYGEFFEFSNFQQNFDTGLTYLISDHFQIDFSYGTGINHTMNYLSLGFSWLSRSYDP